MLFEALDFEYIGPIPGHKMESLVETFRNVRDFSEGPILIHVLTTKGKGYKPAERNPGDYHGLGPFDIETGKPKSGSGIIQVVIWLGNEILVTAHPTRTALKGLFPRPP